MNLHERPWSTVAENPGEPLCAKRSREVVGDV
jgi:hypothetical protein